MNTTQLVRVNERGLYYVPLGGKISVNEPSPFFQFETPDVALDDTATEEKPDVIQGIFEIALDSCARDYIYAYVQEQTKDAFNYAILLGYVWLGCQEIGDIPQVGEVGSSPPFFSWLICWQRNKPVVVLKAATWQIMTFLFTLHREGTIFERTFEGGNDAIASCRYKDGDKKFQFAEWRTLHTYFEQYPATFHLKEWLTPDLGHLFAGKGGALKQTICLWTGDITATFTPNVSLVQPCRALVPEETAWLYVQRHGRPRIIFSRDVVAVALCPDTQKIVPLTKSYLEKRVHQWEKYKEELVDAFVGKMILFADKKKNDFASFKPLSVPDRDTLSSEGKDMLFRQGLAYFWVCWLYQKLDYPQSVEMHVYLKPFWAYMKKMPEEAKTILSPSLLGVE